MMVLDHYFLREEEGEGVGTAKVEGVREDLGKEDLKG